MIREGIPEMKIIIKIYKTKKQNQNMKIIKIFDFVMSLPKEISFTSRY